MNQTANTSDAAKPEPKDLSRFYSKIAVNRKSSQFKKFYKYFSIPGIANVAGGLPNYKYFPFDTLEGKIASAERSFESRNPESQASKVIVPKFNPPHLDLSTALQYGSAQGFPALYTWIKEFATKHMHLGVPYRGGFDILLTCGNTDGWNKVLETFTGEKYGNIKGWCDILVEKYCYTSATASAIARGVIPIVVDSDEQGFLPDKLESRLREKAINYPVGSRTTLMYTVSIGQNPTGGIVPQKRREEIYAICQRYNVIIVEDEPYWFLQYDEKKSSPWHSGYEFLDSLTQSYLNIDVDGRVIRLDTFSKNIAPGCRLGWITAQPRVIERITRLTESSTQQPSGFVQAMVYKTLAEWGYDGWVKWLEALRDAYYERQKNMCDEIEKYCDVVAEVTDEQSAWNDIRKTKIIEFNRPKGGMFLWIRINFDLHPLRSRFSVVNLSSAFWMLLTQKPHLVLAAPGTMFDPLDTSTASDACHYFRLCFAAIPTDDIIPVSKRFGQATHKFWEIRDVNEIKKLLSNNGDLSMFQTSAVSGIDPVFGC